MALAMWRNIQARFIEGIEQSQIVIEGERVGDEIGYSAIRYEKVERRVRHSVFMQAVAMQLTEKKTRWSDATEETLTSFLEGEGEVVKIGYR